LTESLLLKGQEPHYPSIETPSTSSEAVLIPYRAIWHSTTSNQTQINGSILNQPGKTNALLDLPQRQYLQRKYSNMWGYKHLKVLNKKTKQLPHLPF